MEVRRGFLGTKAVRPPTPIMVRGLKLDAGAWRILGSLLAESVAWQTQAEVRRVSREGQMEAPVVAGSGEVHAFQQPFQVCR